MLSSAVSQGKDSPAFVDKAQSSESASSLDIFFDYEDASNVTDEVCAVSSKVEMEILHCNSDSRSATSSLEDYPGVRKVFFKHDIPLPSSAAVQRLINFAGHIFSPKRGKLLDTMLQNLIPFKRKGKLFLSIDCEVV